MKSTKKIKIIPQGVTVEIDPGKDLFQALTVSGIYIVTYCGGQGICGKCRVRLHGNAPTPSELDHTHLSSEELDEGIRIACGLYPEDGDVVEVPVPASASTYKLEIEDIAFPVDPWQTVSEGKPFSREDFDRLSDLAFLGITQLLALWDGDY